MSFEGCSRAACERERWALKFMKAVRWASSVKNALVRGIFPHQMSFFLDLPWRYIVLSPSKLVARLALTKTSRVLEVGAGSGFYSVAVARSVSAGRLELLDVQSEMLSKARRKLAAQGLSNVGYTRACYRFRRTPLTRFFSSPCWEK